MATRTIPNIYCDMYEPYSKTQDPQSSSHAISKQRTNKIHDMVSKKSGMPPLLMPHAVTLDRNKQSNHPHHRRVRQKKKND